MGDVDPRLALRYYGSTLEYRTRASPQALGSEGLGLNPQSRSLVEAEPNLYARVE